MEYFSYNFLREMSFEEACFEEFFVCCHYWCRCGSLIVLLLPGWIGGPGWFYVLEKDSHSTLFQPQHSLQYSNPGRRAANPTRSAESTHVKSQYSPNSPRAADSWIAHPAIFIWARNSNPSRWSHAGTHARHSHCPIEPGGYFFPAYTANDEYHPQ